MIIAIYVKLSRTFMTGRKYNKQQNRNEIVIQSFSYIRLHR